MQEPLHLRELRVGRLVPNRVVAHHDMPDRGVTAEEAGIHRDPPLLDTIEVVAEALPVPRHALLQRGQRDAFDPRHQPRQVVDVFVAAGREREAAVAAEHRRDTMQRRRAGSRIPEQLGVVVRVQVDESGRDDEAIGVDRARRRIVDVADLDNAAVANRDVGPARLRTGAVDDGAVPDDDVDIAHGMRSSSGTG